MWHPGEMITTQQLHAMTTHLNDLEQQVRAARTARNDAIITTTTERMKQVDIVRATGLTREQIRRIVRAAENSGPSEQ